jgi:hypothetical protein
MCILYCIKHISISQSFSLRVLFFLVGWNGQGLCRRGRLVGNQRLYSLPVVQFNGSGGTKEHLSNAWSKYALFSCQMLLLEPSPQLCSSRMQGGKVQRACCFIKNRYFSYFFAGYIEIAA